MTREQLAHALTERKDEQGWLIEGTTPDGLPIWWTAQVMQWSFDAFKGVRFARKEDAERIIASWDKSLWPFDARATEHGFAAMEGRG